MVVEPKDLAKLLLGEEKRKTKLRRKIPKAVKEAVWGRYIGIKKAEGKCYVCNRTIHITRFEVGHNKAVARGGSDNITNLRPICRSCNLAMGTMSIETFKRKYFSKTSKKSVKERVGKTRRGQSYRCTRSLSGRIIYCGKKRANKSCLRHPLTGTKCPDLKISRK